MMRWDGSILRGLVQVASSQSTVSDVQLRKDKMQRERERERERERDDRVCSWAGCSARVNLKINLFTSLESIGVSGLSLAYFYYSAISIGHGSRVILTGDLCWCSYFTSFCFSLSLSLAVAVVSSSLSFSFFLAACPLMHYKCVSKWICSFTHCLPLEKVWPSSLVMSADGKM